MSRFHYEQISEQAIQSMNNYIKKGWNPGQFLTAIFANDLWEAVNRADDDNIYLIPTYVSWIHIKAPMGCHGSYEIVNKWQKKFRKE